MELNELVKDFLVKSYENLCQIDHDLIILKRDVANTRIIDKLIRAINAMGSAATFLSFEKLKAVSHAGKNLLQQLRAGKLQLNPEITSALVAMVDASRKLLSCIETTGQDGKDNYEALVATLTHLSERRSLLPSSANGHMLPKTRSDMELEGISNSLRVEAKIPLLSSNTESTIQVKVTLLGELKELIGELTRTCHNVVQYATSQKAAPFLEISRRLNFITTELCNNATETRLQPIGDIWRQLPSEVAGLAVSFGKQIRVEMNGEEAKLDKTMARAIKESLAQLIRNVMEHGIELPEVRAERGKPVEGCLKLEAHYEGEQICIEITDDGNGIDTERVITEALKKDIITLDQAKKLSRNEVARLLFLPEFSAAKKTDGIGGRGAGMDVAKTRIEQLSGTIGIQSVPQRGTTIKILIPGSQLGQSH